MNKQFPDYRLDRRSYEEPNDRAQARSTSLIEEYLDEIDPPLSMLAAHRGDEKPSHIQRVTSSIPANVTDSKLHTECLIGHHVVDHTPNLCFSKPTDTVRGIAGSDMALSADSSLSSSYHDLRTDIPKLFDQAIVEGMAVWAEEHCNGDSQRHRSFDREPENEVEAEIMAARALQACGMIPRQVDAPRKY